MDYISTARFVQQEGLWQHNAAKSGLRCTQSRALVLFAKLLATHWLDILVHSVGH